MILSASESKASQISKNSKLENLWRNLEPLQPHLPRKKSGSQESGSARWVLSLTWLDLANLGDVAAWHWLIPPVLDYLDWTNPEVCL